MNKRKKIKGYEDYLIDEYGIIYSTKRNINLKPDKSKYHRVTLCKDGNTKRFQTHRLVADNFIPNEFNKPLVHHIDGDYLNNHYTNLMWCTHKEHNDIHGYVEMQKYNNSNKKKIIMLDYKTLEIINEFTSIADGARFILGKENKEKIRRNVKNAVGRIVAVCKNKRNSAYGYVWRYSEDI